MKTLPSKTELELLLLVLRERTGREVAKLYRQQHHHDISYGTLYTTFRRLKDAGWINARESADADGRLRYFLITGAGVRALDNAREQATELTRLTRGLRAHYKEAQ